jgi:ribose/xylose/arabinose/galactoside ABC-type transport system permease subunit
LGSLNGIIITKLKIPAFITTLATFFIFRAFAYIYCNGNPVLFQKPWFTVLGNGTLVGLPVPFLIFIGLAIIGTIILRRTPLGRYILAIGNSEKASTISGINIAKIKIIIFGLVGVFTAASAILLSSRLWSANPGMKEGYELEVIAAVVLGGTSLAGGKGSIFNTVIAAIFMATLNTTMNMFHVDSYMQRVMIGFVLLIAFSLTGIRQFFEDKMRVRKSKSITNGSVL